MKPLIGKTRIEMTRLDLNQNNVLQCKMIIAILMAIQSNGMDNIRQLIQRDAGQFELILYDTSE